MKHHLIALTVDTDPDGLSGITTNRQALTWKGLERMPELPGLLSACPALVAHQVPVTWFIRADGQLRSAFGTPLYLYERFNQFWEEVGRSGHELGWHPHLYRCTDPGQEPELIIEAPAASDELERLWIDLTAESFHPTSFRNGEGWHLPETFSVVERLGFQVDSTAIPGRLGGPDHPMNWQGAPNQPYFPDPWNLCARGARRSLLEIPLNTWPLKATHDARPRLRYMNPTVHGTLFQQALDWWETAIENIDEHLCVWALVFHPDEAMPTDTEDHLYSHSLQQICANLASFARRVEQANDSLEFVTISGAAERWKARELAGA